MTGLGLGLQRAGQGHIDGQEPKVLPKGWVFNVARACPTAWRWPERAGRVLTSPRRRAKCPLIRRMRPGAGQGLHIREGQDHFDRRLRLVQHALLQRR